MIFKAIFFRIERLVLWGFDTRGRRCSGPGYRAFGGDFGHRRRGRHAGRRGYRIASIAALLSLLFASQAQGAADRLERWLSNFARVSAHFEQRTFDDEGGLLEDAQGQALIHRPGRFRFEYQSPSPLLVVGDGERVWIHDEELAQVTVRRLDDMVRSAPAALLVVDRPLAEDFTIDSVDPANAPAPGFEWFSLIPSDQGAAFSRILLAFAAGRLERMVLSDQFGQTTYLEFSDIRKDPPLDDDAFVFSPPPGTDVIGDVDGRKDGGEP
ncbi:LolA family protein [Thioalkalivibrio sp. HK1]|uniref:LolA family protein n=1 Tax=Thioalkalivibrio sp. HK1 TaxID=1469245 RepID=UPI00046ED3D6|nr:outer membrane lipoprotein carrier protein LolA [Thioalkalivibrio sp. HK1]